MRNPFNRRKRPATMSADQGLYRRMQPSELIVNNVDPDMTRAVIERSGGDPLRFASLCGHADSMGGWPALTPAMAAALWDRPEPIDEYHRGYLDGLMVEAAKRTPGGQAWVANLMAIEADAATEVKVIETRRSELHAEAAALAKAGLAEAANTAEAEANALAPALLDAKARADEAQAAFDAARARVARGESLLP